jgi:hypothetical protein
MPPPTIAMSIGTFSCIDLMFSGDRRGRDGEDRSGMVRIMQTQKSKSQFQGLQRAT